MRKPHNYMVSASIFATAIFFCFSSGCQPVEDTCTGESISRLTQWGEGLGNLTVQEASQIKVDAGLPYLLSLLKKNGLIEAPHPNVLLKDAWGRPFQPTVKQSPSITIIRILSLGANGIDQNGQGDDLYVEVSYSTGEPKPRVVLHAR